MTSPRFVAGQMVRIELPGTFGHGKRGVVYSVRDSGLVKVVVAHDNESLILDVLPEVLRDAEHPECGHVSAELDSTDPDPRLAIAQAVACAWIGTLRESQLATMTSDVSNIMNMKAAKLGAQAAQEIVSLLNKGD